MRYSLIVMVFVVLIAIFGAGCTPSASLPEQFETLPEGNAGSGAALFNQSINGAPTCVSCHVVDQAENGGLIGPSLQGYGDIAANRVDGQTAEEYTFYSIVRPAQHIVDGYSNAMYIRYNSALSQQQIADLIAYMLNL